LILDEWESVQVWYTGWRVKFSHNLIIQALEGFINSNIKRPTNSKGNIHMKVFKDIISGDEFLSDSYPYVETYNGVCLEVKARYVKKGSDQIAIASDDVIEEDENAPTVIDLVDSFQYNEVTMTQKDIMAWAKPYLAKVAGKLEAAGKPERAVIFKKEATNLLKFIFSKLDEMQTFYGKAYDTDGALCFCYTANADDAGPTFLFFNDGLRVEKF